MDFLHPSVSVTTFEEKLLPILLREKIKYTYLSTNKHYNRKTNFFTIYERELKSDILFAVFNNQVYELAVPRPVTVYTVNPAHTKKLSQELTNANFIPINVVNFNHRFKNGIVIASPVAVVDLQQDAIKPEDYVVQEDYGFDFYDDSDYLVKVPKPIADEVVNLADRYNAGKIDWTLVDWKSLEAMVKVLEFGQQKYSRDNWKKGLATKDILRSIFRHAMAMSRGELLDPESGLPHYAHLACNAMFMAYMVEQKPEMDNLFTKD